MYYYLFCYSKGIHRFLTIWKKDRPESGHSIMTFNLTHNSKHVVQNLLQRFPITNKEHTDLLQHTERGLTVLPEAAGKHFFNIFPPAFLQLKILRSSALGVAQVKKIIAKHETEIQYKS